MEISDPEQFIMLWHSIKEENHVSGPYGGEGCSVFLLCIYCFHYLVWAELSNNVVGGESLF